jgi:hypothetical protein
MHTEIGSDTHHSVNTDDNHNTCDTSDEDPRPAKRRKSRSARAVTPPLHLRRSPPPPPTTRAKIDEAESQNDHRCSSIFIDEQNCASQTSRSPSAASEVVPFTESWEQPLQCFLKCTKSGSETTYNLEFKLPSISGHLHLPIDLKALDINHDAATHSKIHQAPLQPKKRRVKWTPEEEATLFNIWNDGCSWEEIAAALPGRSEGTIRVRYSTKFKK